ncbi:MAG: cysteine desulfurase family protein [Oscillospiraceae bacterium]|jgi:cysteine desulfurase|uniref:cysteine desulfurase n=1 Tax=Caproicibacterium lactatifermentans TaxID=2666138 RepID=A0A859DTH1_9FIRM|nr:cysteine desulfurase family protein [Caproicibacterium lactatifermentans]MDD4808180.1 cysteine desulfurase family protein [Oscillospiraceae bacterium]QKN23493.1 aminotransferase class V-fold PLP-dependent enzyme [Caproicibacterium lactatifermentans]
MQKIIYADNAATTPLSQKALTAMMPYLTEFYGNPSALYSLGRRARKAVEQARDSIAACLGATPEEIYFTACGTESDNWALRGMAAEQAKSGRRHIITSVFEHHAVLHTCQALEQKGFSVTYLPVTKDGYVRPEDLQAALTPKTALVSIMYANNELGTVQPVRQLADICRTADVPFHTDAVQAAGHLPINVHLNNIDLLSLSAHKFGGPKGCGVLYIRRGLHPANLLCGGAQEQGRRGGTENTAGIVGTAAALRERTAALEQDTKCVSTLRDRLERGLLAAVPGCFRNGGSHRLPGHLNLCFPGTDGEALLLLLDQQGICASAGSACAAGSIEPSHVLQAIGLDRQAARSSLRFSLGVQNTEEDVDQLLQAVPDAVKRLHSF